MTIEDRLRNAIAARTRSVEPSDDGLERITEKLDDHGGDMNFDSPQTRWYLAAAAAVVLAGIAGGIVVLGDDGDDGDRTNTANQSDTTVDGTDTTDDTGTGTTDPRPDDTTTTPSTRPPTETTGGPGTTAATAPPSAVSPDELQSAMWPRPSSTVRFDDPVAAVRSWARYYAGYVDPVVGPFQQGDNRSGEVSVRPLPSGQGPETITFVRQLSDDHWYVIGSITADITVTSPASGAQLTCPQALRGTALAYEGTVQVRIDAYQPDGDRVTVYEGFVTGSGSPPAGPFSDDVACSIPTGVESYGIVRFTTVDEGDVGGVLEAVTFPIRLR